MKRFCRICLGGRQMQMNAYRFFAGRRRASFHPIWTILFAVVVAAATTLIAHMGYRSAYSNPQALDTVEGFLRQYNNGIYAYRILCRESLMWINDALFGGDQLYTARAIQNGFALLCLNLSLVRLMPALGVPTHRYWRVILTVDAFCVLCLWVNSNPYTLPLVALFSWGAYFVESRNDLGFWIVLVIGLLSHELAATALFYWCARNWGTADRWPAGPAIRAVLPKSVLMLMSAACIYVGLRLVITPDVPPAGYTYDGITLYQFTWAPTYVSVAFICGVFAAYLGGGGAQKVIRSGRGHTVIFLCSALPLGLYYACFALLVEVRLFLPYFVILVVLGDSDPHTDGPDSTLTGATPPSRLPPRSRRYETP